MMEDETTDHGIEGLICEGQLLHWLDPKINRHVTALSFVTSARDHLRSGINARDQPGRTDPSIDLLGEITGSAPDIEHRLSWSQLRQVGGARAKPPSLAQREQEDEQIIAARPPDRSPLCVRV